MRCAWLPMAEDLPDPVDRVLKDLGALLGSGLHIELGIELSSRSEALHGRLRCSTPSLKISDLARGWSTLRVISLATARGGLLRSRHALTATTLGRRALRRDGPLGSSTLRLWRSRLRLNAEVFVDRRMGGLLVRLAHLRLADTAPSTS